MQRKGYSRREFMRDVSLMGGSAYFVCFTLGCEKTGSKTGVASVPDAATRVSLVPAGLKTFTADEYRIIAAASARLLPSDDTGPGALEAGVPDYIDCMLASTPIERQKQDFLAGLASFDRQAKANFGGAYPDLREEFQDEMLKRFQFSRFTGEQKFFNELLVLTLEGFLGDPRYGGNRDKVGWKFTGFEPPMPHSNAHGCSHPAPEPVRGG
jgi:gluconate 2-dehydrogenase gamma chain